MKKYLALVLLLAVLLAFLSGCVQPTPPADEEPVSDETLDELSSDIESLESDLQELDDLENLEDLGIDESLFE